MGRNRVFDPLVQKWAEQYREPRKAARQMERFFEYLKMTPAEALERQRLASISTDEKERFRIVDLAQEFIRSIEGRKVSKICFYTYIKTFFRFHRRKLPDDYDMDFTRSLKDDRPSVSTKVTPEILREMLILVKNDPRKRSMILTQYMSFGGLRELMLINENYGFFIGEQIKKGNIPIELEMKWTRKRNAAPYYTYLGTLACEALKEYFEKKRGYPKEGECIWPSRKRAGGPLTKSGVGQIYMRLFARLGVRPSVTSKAEGRPRWVRYGVGAHELRTLSISLSQAAAGHKSDDGTIFNPESVEFFAGHQIDPLNYRQLFTLDPSYRRKQYEIVEKFLDPAQYGLDREVVKAQAQKMQVMEEKLQRLSEILEGQLKA